MIYAKMQNKRHLFLCLIMLVVVVITFFVPTQVKGNENDNEIDNLKKYEKVITSSENAINEINIVNEKIDNSSIVVYDGRTFYVKEEYVGPNLQNEIDHYNYCLKIAELFEGTPYEFDFDAYLENGDFFGAQRYDYEEGFKQLFTFFQSEEGKTMFNNLKNEALSLIDSNFFEEYQSFFDELVSDTSED